MQADADFDKQKLLSKSFVFQALDDQARRELASFAYVKRFAAGETVFTMGASGQSMMAIAEGTVRVTMHTPSGREITLNDMQAGEIFGEIALLDGGERSATVKALANCTLVVVERRSLLDVLRHNPQLSVRLVELLCHRVRRSDQRMIEIAFLDLPARLAKLLLKLTELHPGTTDKPLKKLSQSQSELAGMIGNSRENVNRCLRKWQKAELILLQDGWLIINDRAALQDMAADDDIKHK